MAAADAVVAGGETPPSISWIDLNCTDRSHSQIGRESHAARVYCTHQAWWWTGAIDPRYFSPAIVVNPTGSRLVKGSP